MSCRAVVPLEGFEDVVRMLIPSLASLFQIPGSLLDALCGVEHVLLIQTQNCPKPRVARQLSRIKMASLMLLFDSQLPLCILRMKLDTNSMSSCIIFELKCR
jgi:hypothetical protein